MAVRSQVIRVKKFYISAPMAEWAGCTQAMVQSLSLPGTQMNN